MRYRYLEYLVDLVWRVYASSIAHWTISNGTCIIVQGSIRYQTKLWFLQITDKWKCKSIEVTYSLSFAKRVIYYIYIYIYIYIRSHGGWSI